MRRAARKIIPQADEVERQRHETIGADFIRIELELADTFCKLALETQLAERKQQNEINAHRALNAALDRLTKLHLKEKEVEEIVTKIEEVKALLEAVEANGSSHPSC